MVVAAAEAREAAEGDDLAGMETWLRQLSALCTDIASTTEAPAKLAEQRLRATEGPLLSHAERAVSGMQVAMRPAASACSRCP